MSILQIGNGNISLLQKTKMLLSLLEQAFMMGKNLKLKSSLF